jgi:HAD superfamily hydrolase (TIGR01459 family)
MSAPAPTLLPHFSALAHAYDVVLCDVWGVVHNGVIATEPACDALARFRARGGIVVLITNAPRPGEVVKAFLDGVKVPPDAYDGIVSSGDVTRALMITRAGERIFHIGPERDVPMFAGLVRVSNLEVCDYVVCSGLHDDTTETPADYDGTLAAMGARGLMMLCANPDVVVERGPELVYCAGAIAERYAAAGGQVIYAGKPHAPIYDQALALAQSLRGRSTDRARVLAIGDSVRTDIKGASDYGLPSLFVTAGIHAEELGGRENPSLSALANIFAAADLRPIAVMRQLEW